MPSELGAVPNSRFQNSSLEKQAKNEITKKIQNKENVEQIVSKNEKLSDNINEDFHSIEFTAIINECNVDSYLLGQEPWPEDVKLYQPYETEQILLPDNANCLAVHAFLKMCNLNYQVEYKANAENMSPSGRVPFIKCGAVLVSELEPIVSFVSNKGISLTTDLDASQKSDMRAYMSLVNTVLGNAENYITWVDSNTYSEVTKPRYGSVHPFPLNHILSYTKRQSVIKRLTALGWYYKTLDQVYAEVCQCCQALSERLGSQDFFFGEKPCELDAAVFGHCYAILTNPSFPAGLKLAEKIRNYWPLMEHCRRLMPKLLLAGIIDEPCLHPLYIKTMKVNSKNSGDVCDEFVFYDDEDEDLTPEAIQITTLDSSNREYSIFD